MPEKFMTFAVLGFVTCAMLAAWLHSKSMTSRQISTRAPRIPRPRLFYINLIQLTGILVFLGLAYPALFFMSGFSPRIALTSPTGVTWLLLALLGSSLVISVVRGRLRNWWSPFPLLQGVLASSALASWLGETHGLLYPLWPDWRYIGGACVLYMTALVLIDGFLWLTHKPTQDNEFMPEFARLCAVLPALLVYAVGVRV